MTTPSPTHKATLQAPTGTRDFYPADLARRRFIESAWRTASVRHGFDEIDGPTFEHLDLYTIKSGDGIVSELFSFSRSGGEKPYALRPEFTPTLARLFAARAPQLPRPTKWFWQSTCFRAERPQRGRLREFLQWNCDILGGEDRAAADAEIIAVCVDLLSALGLTPADVTVKINDRAAVAQALAQAGLTGDPTPGLVLLDKRAKLPEPEFARHAAALGLDLARFDGLMAHAADQCRAALAGHTIDNPAFASLSALAANLRQMGLSAWCAVDPSIVRGLAYYTGMVFEVIADGERAVAGGGRYDNLVELFGGPPTSAVGFGMGDVVLSLLLTEKKLMPDDRAIARALGLAPHAFVLPNGSPEAESALVATVAALRRAGLHTRRSYKTTRNVGKLLKEAADSGAHFAVILESDQEATVKDLSTNTQWPARVPLASLPTQLKPPASA